VTAASSSIWSPFTHRPTEVGFLALWFYTVSHRFEGDIILLYGLVAYFLLAIFLHRNEVLRVLSLGRILLLFPALALLSVLWSAMPPDTIRYALMIFLTLMICVYAVARFKPRQIIFAFFAAASATAFLSIPQALSAPGDAIGVFDQKNVLAARMTVLAFASLALLMDREVNIVLRLFAGAMLVLALGLMVLANSATAYITGALGIAFLVGYIGVWRPFRGARILAIASVVLVAGAATFVLAQDPYTDPVQQVFDAFGKDRTMTGRSVIWMSADRLIERNPVFGLGANAFWTQQSPEGYRIMDLVKQPRGPMFSFHNSYLEVGVHLGYVGMALAVVIVGWCIWMILGAFFVNDRLSSAFFVAMLIIALPRSMVETELFKEFDYIQMIIWIGALMGAATLAERKSDARRERGVGSGGQLALGEQ
jgi:exopolysaccharide production protein ExoQ